MRKRNKACELMDLAFAKIQNYGLRVTHAF